MYDSLLNAWVNASIDEVIETFVGATANSAGVAGLVPAPLLGQTNAFLRSDGTWCEINSSQNITTIINDDNKNHDDIINEINSMVVSAIDDIVIIKDSIANNKYQHTAYVYNGIAWEAMDGNYNAENVYFKNDFIFTEPIGTVEIPSTGNVTVPAAGKNVKEFLSNLFAEEKIPNIILPGADIVPSSTITAYEVGSTFTPGYSIRFYGGNYQYDNSTGVLKTGQKINDNQGNTSTQSSTSFSPLLVIDGFNYQISGTVSYSDGNIPITNLGNEYPEGQIKANTVEANSSTIVIGYRKAFYGTLEEKKLSLTSGDIRGLSGKSSSGLSNGSSFSLNIPVGALRTVIAYPAALRDLTSVKDTNALNADIVSSFKEYSVMVEGFNGYNPMKYKVYVLDYAYPLPTSNIYKVTI